MEIFGINAVQGNWLTAADGTLQRRQRQDIRERGIEIEGVISQVVYSPLIRDFVDKDFCRSDW